VLLKAAKSDYIAHVTISDIENDVVAHAEKLARAKGTSPGKELSELARRGIAAEASEPKWEWRNGVPVLPSTGEVITMEKIQQIMDEEGI
jgi:hypothetical protein